MEERHKEALEFKHKYSKDIVRLLDLYKGEAETSEVEQALEFRILLHKLTDGNKNKVVIENNYLHLESNLKITAG